MKYIKIALLLSIIFYIKFAISQDVDSVFADMIAKNFFNMKKGYDHKDIVTKISYIEKLNDTILYYAINLNNNQGYFLLSADKRAKPIIAYSFNGVFNSKEIPPNFKSMLDEFCKQLLHLKRSKYIQSNYYSEWKKLENLTNYENFDDITVGPILKVGNDYIWWDQGCGYNNSCPFDLNSNACYNNDNVHVGCVAVSMGSIMRYWEFPHHGNNSHGYTHPDYLWLFADFANEI
ncbi:MAG: C10 family peptidase, partial [Bacteroidales bacterium]|nr:C10 family peptidase [Bacteroidales bacterium]